MCRCEMTATSAGKPEEKLRLENASGVARGCGSHSTQVCTGVKNGIGGKTAVNRDRVMFKEKKRPIRRSFIGGCS